MSTTIILLSISLLICAGLFISCTFIARAQYKRAQNYERIIEEGNQILLDFGEDVLNTYNHIKNIDNKQMFEKDDDVGVIFQDMVDIIEKFNSRTQSRLEY